MNFFGGWFNKLTDSEEEALISKQVEASTPVDDDNYFDRVKGDEMGVVGHNEVEDAKNMTE